MLKSKTLAYGDGMNEVAKPKVIKRLGFSGIALMLATANCATANALPRDRIDFAGERTVQADSPRRARAPPPVLHSSCMPDMDQIAIGPRERRLETACSGGREFVLTESRLYIRSRESRREAEGAGEIRLLAHISITDISGYAAQGIVHWQPTEDSVIIITRNDRKLTVLPDEGMGETVPSYTMPFDTSGITRQRVAYQSGHLFIAPPSSDMLVMTFGGHPGSVFLPLRSSAKGDGFAISGGRLFFGSRGGQETEIRISGPGVTDVGLIR
jgi:hypothetical protein